MDNFTIAGLSSIGTLLVTAGIYLLYRICYHFHLKSKCCGRNTEIDWTTQTPPEMEKIKSFIANKEKKSEV